MLYIMHDLLSFAIHTIVTGLIEFNTVNTECAIGTVDAQMKDFESGRLTRFHLQDQPRQTPNRTKSIKIGDTCTKVFDSEHTSKRVIGLMAILLILMLKTYIYVNILQ